MIASSFSHCALAFQEGTKALKCLETILTKRWRLEKNLRAVLTRQKIPAKLNEIQNGCVCVCVCVCIRYNKFGNWSLGKILLFWWIISKLQTVFRNLITKLWGTFIFLNFVLIFCQFLAAMSFVASFRPSLVVILGLLVAVASLVAGVGSFLL